MVLLAPPSSAQGPREGAGGGVRCDPNATGDTDPAFYAFVHWSTSGQVTAFNTSNACDWPFLVYFGFRETGPEYTVMVMPGVDTSLVGRELNDLGVPRSIPDHTFGGTVCPLPCSEHVDVVLNPT